MIVEAVPSLDVVMHRGLIFKAWACVIGSSPATYLSGPITTGLRWVEAVEAQGGVDRDAIIQLNSREIMAAAERLRAVTDNLVVEPSSLSVQGWSQDDYLALWTGFIDRHATELRMMPGWQYSIGCAREFERAVRREVPVLTIDGRPLSAADGWALLAVAAGDLAGRSRGSPGLQPLTAALQSLVSRNSAANLRRVA